VLIGRANPGNAISGNIGFGFALNQRFSFSLGYRHSYIFPMEWVLSGVPTRTSRLQVGSFLMGMSYRLTERKTLNFGLELGATKDAPNVSAVFRIPISSK
jgi:long-subunit fatty acid transport protein